MNRILGIIGHWFRNVRIRICNRNVFCYYFFINVDFLIGFVSRIYVTRR